MFYKNQSITYLVDGKEIARLDSSSRMSLPDMQYVRYYQPFVEKGCSIVVPGEVSFLYINHVKGALFIENEIYAEFENGSNIIIKYEGIDLERIIKDGQFKGVNNIEEDDILVDFFPKLE